MWASGVVAGLYSLWAYAFDSGVICQAPKRWPAESSIKPDDARATLLMFLHPQCPCSRASVEELARLMRFAKGRLAVHVCVFAPTMFPEDWVRADLWTSASAIPEVEMHGDPDAIEARRFKATISGTVLLYGPRRDLLFAGGITNGRGHGGDSVGRATILSLLEGGPVAGRQTPVFGCPIFDSNDAPARISVTRGSDS